jgi:hypothetical protein
MNSTTPQDLLDLKSRIDLWRSTRRFIRQPIPDDIRLAIVQAASRHSPRLVKKVLKLDPYRFKPASSSTAKSAKSVSSTQQIDFVTLSPTTDPFTRSRPLPSSDQSSGWGSSHSLTPTIEP